MMETKPTMKINYVRVYQDVTDEKQKVGCSTPERPTWKYIKANEKLYKKEDDVSMKVFRLFRLNVKHATVIIGTMRSSSFFMVYSLYDMRKTCCVKLLPLKPIQQGRGPCNSSLHPSILRSESCGGGERGTCTAGEVCECKAGWTGPNCLAPDGRNEIEWDMPDSIDDLEIKPPIIIPHSLFIGLLIMVAMLLYTVHTQRRGWSPVPDVKKVYVRDV